MNPRHLPVLFVLVALTACQPMGGPDTRWSTPAVVPSGPRTAVPNVEVYEEDPVLSFQRTGAQPAPYAVLPLGVEVKIRRQSGPFSEIDLAGGKRGWVRTSSLSGVGTSPPPMSDGTNNPVDIRGGGTSPDVIIPPDSTRRDDIIDLDRLP